MTDAKYPCESVSFFEKGKTATNFQPGDFILIHDETFFAKIIHFGQSLRFRNSRFNLYNHAALIVTPEGGLIESDPPGVKLTDFSNYKDMDYILVRISAPIDQRQNEVNFAAYCLSNKQKYGWLTIISIAFCMLTGLKFSFGFDGEEICSGLVASALCRTSTIFAKDPSHISPSELASFYLK